MAKNVNKAELAAIVGVTERTLTTWQKQGMPIEHEGERGEENAYDTAAVVTWMVARAEAKAKREETPRDRLARRQADLLDMQLAEKRGDSVQAASIKPRLIARVIGARQKLIAMVADIAPALAELGGRPDAIADLLEANVDDALRDVAGDPLVDADGRTDAGRGVDALGAAGADAAVGVGGEQPAHARRVRRTRAVPVPHDAIPAGAA